MTRETASNESVHAFFQQVQEGNVYRKAGDLRIYARAPAQDALRAAGLKSVPFFDDEVLVNLGSLRTRLQPEDLALLDEALGGRQSFRSA